MAGPVSIVFHGATAAPFAQGFAELLTVPAQIALLPDRLEGADARAYAAADVIVTWRFTAKLPRPERLSLLHVPGAGTDQVEFAAVPPGAVVCNCFEHEAAIAEYAFASLLMLGIPMVDADRRLRGGDWTYRGGSGAPHQELAGRTLGILGFGRIGRAVATRAKAFEMRVHAANRSPVPAGGAVDRAFSLKELGAFWSSADAFVVALPLTPETRGIVDRAAFAAMRPTAVLVNVGRGATVDERALYDALAARRIAGAAIDVWYRYPTPDKAVVLPSELPFHELPNVLMTPHYSGWSTGTVRRRQRVMADNVARRVRGEPCEHVVTG